LKKLIHCLHKNSLNMKQQIKRAGSKTVPGNTNADGNGKKEQGSLLEEFFTDQLKDIYYAEQQLLKGLEKMQKAATSEELEDAFSDHAKQTERHVKRLERVFKMIGKKPEGKTCEAMDGLLREAESIISETDEGTMTRDAALIIAAQKVEHYEIATYGGLVQLALTMRLNQAADILEKTLTEEEDTDQLLTFIAEAHINLDAEQEGGYSWQKQEETEETETADAGQKM
jgi:ferritin-like metal-binding protein YciE